MRHLGAMADLSPEEVIRILDRAEHLRSGGRSRAGAGRVLTLAFFQLSTRTRTGFASAGIRLGFGTVDLFAPRHDARMSQSESLEDTLRVVSAYSDSLVLRHPADDAWAAATLNVTCPIINGGNGNGEHPTQALIDLFAIRRAVTRLEGLTVGIVGDIRGSRSAHSLMKALSSLEPKEIRLMGPEGRLDITDAMTWCAGVTQQVTVYHHLHLQDLDVLYVAGLPPGMDADRIPEAERVRFAVTPRRLQQLPDAGVVLCPLPRIDEIAPEIDRDRRARFFEQSDDGLWVRMAILEHAISHSESHRSRRLADISG
jgi:aspartate carbamoyltransferase catalytic subunit